LSWSPNSLAQQGGGRASATANLPFDPKDLSGIWGGQSTANLTKDEPPMTPAGLKYYQAQGTEYSNPPKDGPDNTDPILRCEPSSAPRSSFLTHPIEIEQTPALTVMLLESYRNFRMIYTDGRKFPDHPEGGWYGDSLGHWEGNTFVIETRNYNGRSWVDKVGHPLSDQSVVTERLTRTDHDHMRMEINIHDPVNYTKDWGGAMIWTLRPANWEIEDFLCSPQDEQFMNKVVRDPAVKK
jgi:hypothetical protein